MLLEPKQSYFLKLKNAGDVAVETTEENVHLPYFSHTCEDTMYVPSYAYLNEDAVLARKLRSAVDLSGNTLTESSNIQNDCARCDNDNRLGDLVALIG